MVYSVRCDRPIISTKPLKTKMPRNEYSKSVEDFMRTHDISISNDSSGTPVVTVTKKVETKSSHIKYKYLWEY